MIYRADFIRKHCIPVIEEDFLPWSTHRSDLRRKLRGHKDKDNAVSDSSGAVRVSSLLKSPVVYSSK